MQIEVKKTTEWTPLEWSTYVQGFNQVFQKDYSADFFQHKYFNTIDGCSYHALLKVNGDFVGGCTVIPYYYSVNKKIIRVGLAVDVFIVDEYRTDPLTLYRMYKKLKAELILNGIALVIAVPNDIAYPYWKNIVKWKDIGYLSYYVFPLKVGEVIPKLPKFFNLFSLLGSKFLVFFSSMYNVHQKDCAIYIDRSNNVIEKQRYTEEHIRTTLDNFYFSYRIMDEDGVKTAYLIDFYNQNSRKKDNRSLREAVKFIYKQEMPDLIIFVGKLPFFQFLLFKVPFKYEPKHLYFTIDVLIKEKIPDLDSIFKIENWDFGLFNYDVR